MRDVRGLCGLKQKEAMNQDVKKLNAKHKALLEMNLTGCRHAKTAFVG